MAANASVPNGLDCQTETLQNSPKMTTTLTKSNVRTTSKSKHHQQNTIDDTVVVPDSTTTVEKEMPYYIVGQDVLVKQKDGRYYFGNVVEVDSIREQCLVKYGDNTENWSQFKDVTKLSSTLEQEEQLLCVVCKKAEPKSRRVITVCDQCGRGYHQKCHQPEIPINCQKEDATWMCKRCLDSEPNRLRKSYTKQLRRDSLRNSNSSCSSSHDIQVNPTSTTTKVLPYELSSLNWDTYHRVNAEQIYCYCGGNGDWFKQMLQCARCKQWFHDRCIDCLQYPLYCGDRFYIYVCSICNQGKDFLRRLEMKWVDIVHLMLYNLTAYNCRKYYELDTVLVPYINDNWHTLQLPPKILHLSKTDRRENIVNVLSTNRNRFKCGKEIKKRTTIWGLRVRLPPPAPCVTVPAMGLITDHELRDMWQGNRRIPYLPHIIQTTLDMPRFNQDSHIRNIMMGIAYEQHTANSESDSPCPSPDTDHRPDEEDDEESNTYKFLEKSDFLGAGCAKKSVPLKKMSLQRRKKLLAMSNRDRERLIRRPRRRAATIAAAACRNSKLDKHRLSLDAGRNNEALPLTPPTSVSAPPTPPASGSTSIMSDLSNDFPDGSSSTTIKKELNSLELNTPCDTSGDETSSKSTLDLIIPPPKDFEGKNNPFLALLRGSTTIPATALPSDDISIKTSKQKRNSKEITLPLPLTAVIPGKPVMRPMKRQLSEKDIFIGPNGEVKRKRLRRNRNHSFSGQTASKTAAVVPARPDAKEWVQCGGNCVDYALNGRRLRQRPEKPTEKEVKPIITTSTTSPKPSPVKQEPDISMDDLKSSVNIYFGAANRIAAGERFAVKAKRIGPSGKMEYLIEWEGPSNGMT